MRILVINYEFPPLGGGAGSVCYYLARELVERGAELDVVTMGFRGLRKFEVIDGINVYRVPCLRSKEAICHTHEMISYALSAIPAAIRLIRRNKYDVNHTHFIFPSSLTSYVLKKFTGLPYIVTSHGSDVPGYNPDRFKIEHKFLRPFWKAFVKNASAITSPSQSLKDLILSHYGGTPVEVIPNAIDGSVFRPKQKKKTILMVSRLLPRKGFQFVLEALAGVDTDYTVVVVGDGPYAGHLKNLAREKELNVRFPGWLDNNSAELRELYETSSIFALPSEMENFSIALVEAMASGMAVLTSDAGGCPEVVGDAALSVKPGDVAAIRENLTRLMGDDGLREELGRAARKRVEENFTWPVVTRKYEEVFKRYG